MTDRRLIDGCSAISRKHLQLSSQFTASCFFFFFFFFFATTYALLLCICCALGVSTSIRVFMTKISNRSGIATQWNGDLNDDSTLDARVIDNHKLSAEVSLKTADNKNHEAFPTCF